MALQGERKLGTLVAVLLAVGAIALAAGCGGDDEDSAAQPQTSADNASNQSAGDEAPQEEEGSNTNGDQNGEPSGPKAEFVQEANDVCRQSVRKIQRSGKKVFNELGQNAKEFQDTLINDVLLPNFEAEVRGLRQLEPPPGDEAQVDRIISAIEDFVAGLKNNPDPDDYPYTEAEQLADQYGIDACGAPAPQ